MVIKSLNVKPEAAALGLSAVAPTGGAGPERCQRGGAGPERGRSNRYIVRKRGASSGQEKSVHEAMELNAYGERTEKKRVHQLFLLHHSSLSLSLPLSKFDQEAHSNFQSLNFQTLNFQTLNFSNLEFSQFKL